MQKELKSGKNNEPWTFSFVDESRMVIQKDVFDEDIITVEFFDISCRPVEVATVARTDIYTLK